VANKDEEYFVLAGFCVFEHRVYYLRRYLDDLATEINPANPNAIEFHASEIYAGSEEGILYALNSGGILEWKFPAEGKINSSPLIDVRGNIYFKTSTGRLYAINSRGIKKWSYKTEYSVSSPINLSSEGLLLLSEEGFIYAVGE